jgi:hypothetical protein
MSDPTLHRANAQAFFAPFFKGGCSERQPVQIAGTVP